MEDRIKDYLFSALDDKTKAFIEGWLKEVDRGFAELNGNMFVFKEKGKKGEYCYDAMSFPIGIRAFALHEI